MHLALFLKFNAKLPSMQVALSQSVRHFSQLAHLTNLQSYDLLSHVGFLQIPFVCLCRHVIRLDWLKQFVSVSKQTRIEHAVHPATIPMHSQKTMSRFVLCILL